MCVPGRRSVFCAPVSHEELRALLGPYAAGALEASTAEAVRAHLAGGCTPCIDELYRRPVGIVLRPPDPPPQPAVATSARRGSGWVPVLMGLVVGLGLAGTAAWTAVASVRRAADDRRTLEHNL